MAVLLRCSISLVFIVGTEILFLLQSVQSVVSPFAKMLLIIAIVLFGTGLGQYLFEFLRDEMRNVAPTKASLSKVLATLAIMISGAVLTHYLNIELALGPVVASGLVTTLGAVLLRGETALIAYVASIAGMSSAAILNSYLVTVVSAVTLGVLYLMSDWVFRGIGGKFGTITAAAILILLIWR